MLVPACSTISPFISDLPVAHITSGTLSNASYFVKPQTNQSTFSLSKICQQCQMNRVNTVMEEKSEGISAFI